MTTQKLPWEVEMDGEFTSDIWIRDAEGSLLLSGTLESEDDEENAEVGDFILKAVNSYDALLAALKRLCDRFPADVSDDGTGRIGFVPAMIEAVEGARAVIAQMDVKS